MAAERWKQREAPNQTCLKAAVFQELSKMKDLLFVGGATRFSTTTLLQNVDLCPDPLVQESLSP